MDVLPSGTRLGRYEIVQRLALGGMAEIYLARMSGLAGFAKHVVLKRILPSHARDAEFVRMFFNEARYAATLDHPNIAHVYDLGEDQGLHYFTMEYLHGEDCRTLLRELAQRELRLPLEHALTIVAGAAAGCHFAHEQADDQGRPLGLVHRDVSPSNVVVTFSGAVKLVDFGIAKATNVSAEDTTAIGVTKGKLAYMAPEQCRGEPLDRRVDIYALGVLLYELSTQRRAFAGQNDAQVMWAVISGDVPAPTSLRPDFPPALAEIIRRAMHVDRQARYASARELAQAIEGFARDAGLALNPATLGEFLERTMGPRLEPWRTPERARTPALATPAPLLLPAPLAPAAADAPTFAPGRTPAGALPTLEPGGETAAASADGMTGAEREAETRAELAASTSRGRGRRRRGPWLALAAATAVAAAATSIVLVRGRDRGADDAAGAPVLLVTERGQVALEGRDAAPSPLDAGPAPAAEDAAPAPAGDAGAPATSPDAGRAGGPRGGRPPPPADDPLSRAFARRQGEVGRCFAEHAAGVVDTPSLLLRFEIDAAGTPTRVEVLPPELGQTALGACIARVGRATRFPPQGGPAAFRIPVSVRADRGGGR